MTGERGYGILQLDRFAAYWLGLALLMVVAALVSLSLSRAERLPGLEPAYRDGVTAKEFVFNTYVAHMRGDLERLEQAYSPEFWEEAHMSEMNWGQYGHYHGDLLGVRVLDVEERENGGLTATVATYHGGWDGPLGMRRLEITLHTVPLIEKGDSWQLQEALPRYQW